MILALNQLNLLFIVYAFISKLNDDYEDENDDDDDDDDEMIDMVIWFTLWFTLCGLPARPSPSEA